jgi:ABC-type enterochelin transport system permease subunit
VALKQAGLTTMAAWVVMGAAMSMCGIIMAKLWAGFKKEQAEKMAH